MSDPRRKGTEFENHVIQFLQKALADDAYVGPSLSPIEGASNEWQADIIIRELPKVDAEAQEIEGQKIFSGPIEKAVLECKYAEPADSGSSFDTNLARAYVRLNDIRLKNENLSLFVVVNREPRRGEQSRNYRKMFANIGVQFLNFNDLEDLQHLKTEALKIASKNSLP